jgi:hypothetical protein
VNTEPRDAGNWAKPVSELHLTHDVPPEAMNLNVEGRRLAAPTSGFGKMWQKIYRISLQGADVTPQEVITTWKSHFGEFWPKWNHFYGPFREISPGDVALLNGGVGPLKMSTGILVIYADDVSFSFQTPEGHMFTGMITFSATEHAGVTFAQADGIIRAQDPLYELSMMLGGHRVEDYCWMSTLESLARHFGVEAKATTRRILVDRRRKWRNFGNIRRSAALRSFAYILGTPFRKLRRKTSA